MFRKTSLIALAGIAAAVASPVVARMMPARSFRSVEFADPDLRLPYARELVAHAAPVGTPMAVAAQRIAAAGAPCHGARDGAGLSCQYILSEHPTFDPVRDIVWKVRLTPDGAGNVADASVKRVIYGV